MSRIEKQIKFSYALPELSSKDVNIFMEVKDKIEGVKVQKIAPVIKHEDFNLKGRIETLKKLTVKLHDNISPWFSF